MMVMRLLSFHSWGVIIGDDVEIGPNSTIRRGALGNTIIKNGCKIGSLSNIGHNTEIGEQCILTTQCVVGGSSILGNKVLWNKCNYPK